MGGEKEKVLEPTTCMGVVRRSVLARTLAEEKRVFQRSPHV